MKYEISKRSTGEVLWAGEAYSREQALRLAGLTDGDDLFICILGS